MTHNQLTMSKNMLPKIMHTLWHVTKMLIVLSMASCSYITNSIYDYKISNPVQQHSNEAIGLPFIALIDLQSLQSAEEFAPIIAPSRSHLGEIQIMTIGEGWEHVELGDKAEGGAPKYIAFNFHDRDLPERQRPTNEWPQEWRERFEKGDDSQKRVLARGLTYGEILALAGDLYEDYESLSKAPLLEIYSLIPLIRSKTVTTAEFQDATGDRFLYLARNNANHFRNENSAQGTLVTWKRYHIRAIQTARTAKSEQEIQRAWALNAFADHFLTDAFCGGHIRTPRDKLQGSNQGDLESKILHDIDNERGIWVTNNRRDKPWLALGDRMLDEAKNETNRHKTLEAVALSKNDIIDALSRKHLYPMPTSESKFEVEDIIPFPVDPNDFSNWTSQPRKFPISPVAQLLYGRVYTNASEKYKTYLEQQLIVVRNEGGGFLSGLVSDDNSVRAFVNKYGTAVLGDISTKEKTRMINVLLSGWVSDDDIAAIELIWLSISSPIEASTVYADTEKSMKRLNDLAQYFRVYKSVCRIIPDALRFDDEIRAWVQSRDSSILRKVIVSQKIRMINRLLDGWVSDDDVVIIELICASSSEQAEKTQIANAVSARLSELRNLKQRLRVANAIGVSTQN